MSWSFPLPIPTRKTIPLSAPTLAPAIACGAYGSYVLKGNGKIVAWGSDFSSFPYESSNFVAIATAISGDAGYAIQNDGTIVAWGNNTYGQLNIPYGLSSVVSVSGGLSYAIALKSNGTVVAWGDDSAIVPAGLSNVVEISLGYRNGLALQSDGTVVGWGYNATPPTGLLNVVAISAGDCSLALKSDGTVVAWGDNKFGQLNIPYGLSNVVAVEAGEVSPTALKSDGTIVTWGYTTVAPVLSNVVAISGDRGNGGFLAIKSDSTVVGWGHAQSEIPYGLSVFSKLDQTISSFTSISAKTPGATPFTITPPTASSGLTVAVTVKSGPATISGNTITLAGTEGTVVLAANQSGNVDYTAASEVTTSFTVGTIFITRLSSPPSVNNAEPITNSSVVSQISSETKTHPDDFVLLRAGDFGSSFPAVRVTGTGFDYTFYYGYGGQDYILRRDNNTATWTVVLYAQGGGIGNQSFGSSNASFFNFGGNSDCNIPWSYLTQPDSYYSGKTFAESFLSTSGLLQIPLGLMPQTISPLATISAKTPGATPFTITPPTASSGLTVAVTVKSGPATISGNTITLTGTEGTVVLAANQSGNADYNAASEVTTSFTVAKLSQTISSFAAIPQHLGAFTITAPSSSSGLPVAVSVASGPATISGTPGGTYTITPTGNGVVILKADQSGDSTYLYASGVTTSFQAGSIVLNVAVGQFVSFNLTPNDNLTGGTAIVSSVPPGLLCIHGGFLQFYGTPTVAGIYNITVSLNSQNSYYSINVAKATASISLSGLNQGYTGSTLSASFTTNPQGLPCSITYNGSSAPPTNAGRYTVVATINDSNWQGSSTAVMYISPAYATITFPLDGVVQQYTGSAISMPYSTSPANFSVRLSYLNQITLQATTPINSGTYYVVADSADSNYYFNTGENTAMLIIGGESYYYNNATHDGSLFNTKNWWLDSAHTIPATSLPTSLDKVYIDGNVIIPGGLQAASWPPLFASSVGAVIYDQVIVGKYANNIVMPLSWFYPPGFNNGIQAGVVCNKIEFWNGASVDPSFPDKAGFSTGGLAVVHYPCACPFNGLASTGGITYVGYPDAIGKNNMEIPLQTLWIDYSSHGTASWSPQGLNVTSTSLGTVKQGDDLFLQVGFHAGTSFTDPQITEISCTFLDPIGQAVVLDSSDFIPMVATDLLGGLCTYLFHLSISGDSLNSIMGGVSDSLTLLGEIEWKEVNSTGIGPSILTQRSKSFPLVVNRSLSDFIFE